MHHHRRKSGHASANSSMTDVRKATTASDSSSKHKSSRPAAMSRRSTTQIAQKLGKNPRDREREWEEERWWEEERESFPQFWYVRDDSVTHDASHMHRPIAHLSSHHDPATQTPSSLELSRVLSLPAGSLRAGKSLTSFHLPRFDLPSHCPMIMTSEVT
jgi:hypothetical protein